MDEINSTIDYLDDENNFVDEKEATHSIIRETDKNGELIRETYMYMNDDKDIDEDEVIELSQKDVDFIKSFGLNAEVVDEKTRII